MVDAFFDEGDAGFDAAPSGEPQMSMQMQDQSNDDAFADADFPSSAPVVTIQTASGATQNLDDDLTEEEKEIVRVAAEEQDKLKQATHNRMMAEAGEKQERRNAGAAAIAQWQQEKQGQVQLKKSNNEAEESQFHTKRQDERDGSNPWERVTDNCDLTQQGVSANGVDKTRMKQAMLNRKADLAAGGSVVGSFGTNKV